LAFSFCLINRHFLPTFCWFPATTTITSSHLQSPRLSSRLISIVSHLPYLTAYTICHHHYHRLHQHHHLPLASLLARSRSSQLHLSSTDYIAPYPVSATYTLLSICMRLLFACLLLDRSPFHTPRPKPLQPPSLHDHILSSPIYFRVSRLFSSLISDVSHLPSPTTYTVCHHHIHRHHHLAHQPRASRRPHLFLLARLLLLASTYPTLSLSRASRYPLLPICMRLPFERHTGDGSGGEADAEGRQGERHKSEPSSARGGGGEGSQPASQQRRCAVLCCAAAAAAAAAALLCRAAAAAAAAALLCPPSIQPIQPSHCHQKPKHQLDAP
jgi:hypothetical protein